MELPAESDLDDMASLIAGPGVTFATLGPEARIQVIQLVNQCDTVSEMARIADKLGDLDHELTAVGDWFRNSKVYYP